MAMGLVVTELGKFLLKITLPTFTKIVWLKFVVQIIAQSRIREVFLTENPYTAFDTLIEFDRRRYLGSHAKAVYKICKSCMSHGEIPLILAVTFNFHELVGSFVSCAKWYDENLDGGGGGFKGFMEQRDPSGDTALHKAVANSNDFIIMLLVTELPDLLRSVENNDKKTPLSMLLESQFDKTTFRVLALEKRLMNVNAPAAVISIDDQPEPANYTENIMDQVPHNIQIMTSSLDQGELKLSINKNNILHFKTKNGQMTDVSDLVKKHPSLLYLRNLYGETPAYVAAREGHFDILDMFINYLTTYKSVDEDTIEELMTRSTDKDTALHIGIRNHHVGVVFVLTERVPKLASHINANEESPLYLAAEKGYDEIMNVLLQKCKESTFIGPNGKTALHAAALSGSSACVDHLPIHLLHCRDGDDRTALYYAAHLGHSSVVEALLWKDDSIGCYMIDKDDLNFTAHHIAASQGHTGTLEVLLSACHGCPEITNSKGRNILHVAVEKEQEEVIEFILAHKSLGSLINQKDIDGNTPLHLLAASNFEMGALIKDPRIDLNCLNNERKTPLDMASTDDRRKTMLQAMAVGNRRKKANVLPPISKKKELNVEEEFPYFKLMDNVILVATLIATASFATAFSIPGGFNDNEVKKQGQPILLRKASFQVFVVANALAFICSCSSIFVYIMLLLNRYKFKKDDYVPQRKVRGGVGAIYFLTGIALVTMMIAFIAGLYASTDHSKGLAASMCVVCGFIFFLFAGLFFQI